MVQSPQPGTSIKYTLVILLGAIGGMMWFGILGLFVGAITLALGYEIFMAWLDKDAEESS
jgi:predicted PurR-regulated permease PerM